MKASTKIWVEILIGFVVVAIFLLVILFVFSSLGVAVTETRNVASFTALISAMKSTVNSGMIKTISPFKIQTEDSRLSYYGVYYIRPDVARAIINGADNHQVYTLDENSRMQLDYCASKLNDACVCLFKFKIFDFPGTKDTEHLCFMGKDYPKYVQTVKDFYAPYYQGALCKDPENVRSVVGSELYMQFSEIEVYPNQVQDYETRMKNIFRSGTGYDVQLVFATPVFSHLIKYIKVYKCESMSLDIGCSREDVSGGKPCLLLDKSGKAIVWLGTGTGKKISEGGGANLELESITIYKNDKGIVIDSNSYGHKSGIWQDDCDCCDSNKVCSLPFRPIKDKSYTGYRMAPSCGCK